jgi:hypothetical protein
MGGESSVTKMSPLSTIGVLVAVVGVIASLILFDWTGLLVSLALVNVALYIPKTNTTNASWRIQVGIAAVIVFTLIIVFILAETGIFRLLAVSMLLVSIANRSLVVLKSSLER